MNRVAVSCIVAGSAVGGIAAGLFALQSPIQPLSGFNLLLPGFIAAVAGGLGRVIRPAVFGLLVALSEHIVAWHLGAAWQDAIVPVLLVVVLAVGFGRRAFRLNAGWGTKR